MKEKEKLYSTFISFPSHLVRRVGGEKKNYGNGILSMNYESLQIFSTFYLHSNKDREAFICG